jgi:hypothetical protein
MKNNLSKNTTLHPHNETADLQCMAKATNKGLCPFVKPFTKNAVKNSSATITYTPRVCEIAKPGLSNSKAILDFSSDEFYDMVAGTTNRNCGTLIFSTNPESKTWDTVNYDNKYLRSTLSDLPLKIKEVQQTCKNSCCNALYYGNLDKGGTKKGWSTLPKKDVQALLRKNGCFGDYPKCELNRKPNKVVDYCVGNIVKSTKPLPFIGSNWRNWRKDLGMNATCNGTVVREIHVDGLRPNKEKADSSKILFSTDTNKDNNLFLCSRMSQNGMRPFPQRGNAI